MLRRSMKAAVVALLMAASLAATAADKKPIVVGSILDETGGLNIYGKAMADATALAIKHINENGGVYRGMPREQAAEEASLIKATFTGLVMDLFATGDRKRLTRAMNVFLIRLAETVATSKR